MKRRSRLRVGGGQVSSPTPIGDHFDRIVRGEAHRSSPGRRPSPGRHRGGEWDGWFALPRRKRRILIGAQFARRNAMWPDDLADMIERNHPNLDGDPLEWFYRTTFQVLRERRAARNRDRHLRVARQSGHATYYQRRAALAAEAGYPSFWHYRKSKWGGAAALDDREVAA
jgi:hypothetical protein